MLHDANKRLIKVSDIYPEFSDLKKGDYTIRLQLRHDDAVLLDKMKDVPVVVERKLKEPLTVSVYATVRDAIKGAKPVKERSMYAGKLPALLLCLLGMIRFARKSYSLYRVVLCDCDAKQTWYSRSTWSLASRVNTFPALDNALLFPLNPLLPGK